MKIYIYSFWCNKPKFEEVEVEEKTKIYVKKDKFCEQRFKKEDVGKMLGYGHKMILTERNDKAYISALIDSIERKNEQLNKEIVGNNEKICLLKSCLECGADK